MYLIVLKKKYQLDVESHIYNHIFYNYFLKEKTIIS